MTKIRKGTDIVLKIKIDGSTLHTFNEIKKLTTFISQNNSYCKHTHQPTTTSTNICCCGKNQPTSELILNSLVTSSNSTIVTVDALFPADLQMVSGVYCLKIQWQEKTKDLIAEDDIYNYTIDISDVLEIVDTIEDSNTYDNSIVVNFTMSKPPVV